VIKCVRELLQAERTRLVLHLGDFGIWPDRHEQRYLAVPATRPTSARAPGHIGDWHHAQR